MRRWLPFQIMLAVVVALLLMSLQLALAQTTSTPTPTVTLASTIAGKTILVQPTDTVVLVAARNSISVDCLVKANNIPASLSLAGITQIIIPADCNQVAAAGNITLNTPTPESAESLTTATFTPVASGATAIPTATATPSAATVATAVPTVVADQTYTVVYGDRLNKIAAKFGLTVACIANTNSIANPDLIYVGQQLRITANCSGGSGGGGTVSNIPPSTGSTRASCQFDRNAGRVTSGDKYIVQYGDVLDYIACDFGVELKCLKDSNPQLGGLSAIMPGQTLNINFSCPIWRDASLPPLP